MILQIFTDALDATRSPPTDVIPFDMENLLFILMLAWNGINNVRNPET